MSQSKIMMGIGMPISQRSMPRTEPFLYLHHSNRDNNVRRSCEVPSSSDFTRSKAATKLVVLYSKTPFFCPTPGKDRWGADNHQRAAYQPPPRNSDKVNVHPSHRRRWNDGGNGEFLSRGRSSS